MVAIRDSATIDQILDEAAAAANNVASNSAFPGNAFTSSKKPISRLDQAKPMGSLQGAGAFGHTDGADAFASYDSQQPNNLVFSRPIEMRQQRAFICLLRLDPGWKLKTKFKYTLNNSSIEKQKKKLSEE